MITESLTPLARVVWPEVWADAYRASPERPTTILLSDPTAATDPENAASSVLLDFGVELFGGIRCRVLEVLGAGSGRLRVRLGESVSEALVGRYVDRTLVVEAGAELDVGVTGFRFARIDGEDPAVGVRITVPGAYGRARDLPRLGSFASDDPRLDQVWEVGARTVHLCMQDLIWDGIKRGRTVWAGDLHPASRVIAGVFGPVPIVAASLDHLRDRTPAAGDWMNGIPAYSLWWIIGQAEWFVATGDRAYLQAQRDYLSSLLGAIAEGVDAEGREQFEGWRYLDWATTRDFDAIHVGTQGLTAWALRSSQAIALALGDLDLHGQARAILDRVERYRPPATVSKAAGALLVLGGLADPAALNRDLLAPDPLGGLTPFLGYHVLEARASAGDHAGALALIRDYWGAMIDLGATTFWEDFDITWVAGSGRIDAIVPDGSRDIHAGLGRNSQRGMALSLCHAWSAGPTAWLSRHVLGIQPLEPGCRVVRIKPHLGDLSRAEGTYPTPLGVISVQHTRRRWTGRIKTEVQAPDGIEIIMT